ncbi:MAG: TrkA family potassium uptake protein [Actinomycetes bacterium]
MHVVIVGCGRVGSGLAADLETQGHSVSVIDRRAESFRRLPQHFAGDKIVGVGFDRDRLKQAGIERAGALAAVTNGDNSNIVVARVAREYFNVERVVARIYDQRRAAIFERLGISTVATVEWTIDRVLRRIVPDGAGVEWIDPSAQVALVERIMPDQWAGHRLGDLESDGESRLAGLSRLGKGMIASPEVLAQQGDVAWFIVSGNGIDAFDGRLAAGPVKGGH